MSYHSRIAATPETAFHIFESSTYRFTHWNFFLAFFCPGFFLSTLRLSLVSIPSRESYEEKEKEKVGGGCGKKVRARVRASQADGDNKKEYRRLFNLHYIGSTHACRDDGSA